MVLLKYLDNMSKRKKKSLNFSLLEKKYTELLNSAKVQSMRLHIGGVALKVRNHLVLVCFRLSKNHF